MSERTHICGGCGSREDVGYLVDGAIAALQADIKAKDSRIWELESWLQVKSPQEITLMESKIIQFEHQLTQRTAELEAANTLLYKKNCALGRAETSINDLQAELERVRGEAERLAGVQCIEHQQQPVNRDKVPGSAFRSSRAACASMTPQERAEDLYSSIKASGEGFDDDQATDDLCVEMLKQALQATRRAALLEAITKIRQRGDEYMRDCEAKDASGKKYRDTYEMRRVSSGRAWAFKDLADELDRLAQEG